MSLPYCRPLRHGNTGDDVRAVKRAISRWDPAVYPWIPADKGGFTHYFGGRLEQAVKTFQRRHGLMVDGLIAQQTRRRLEASTNSAGDPVFDQIASRLIVGFCKTYAERQQRLAVVAASEYWYQHRLAIAYAQYRPMQLGRPPWVPSRWDCSAFVTACYYAGGAADPNGRGFDGLGYTGTLVAHGHLVAVSALELGDLIFYGFTTKASPAFPVGSPTHVALYVGEIAGVPSVRSHGSYPMNLLPANYRPMNQARSYL